MKLLIIKNIKPKMKSESAFTDTLEVNDLIKQSRDLLKEKIAI
jgi:hypothetical protein